MTRILRHSGMMLGAEGAIVLLSVVSSVLTVRLLGAEGYGQLALAASTAALLFTVGQLALANGILHHWGAGRRDTGVWAGTLWRMLLVAVVVVGVIIAGTLFVSWAVGSLGGPESLLVGIKNPTTPDEISQAAYIAEFNAQASEQMVSIGGVPVWALVAALAGVPLMIGGAWFTSLLQMRGDLRGIATARVTGKVVAVTLLALLAGWVAIVRLAEPDIHVVYGGDTVLFRPMEVSAALPLWIAAAGLAATLFVLMRRVSPARLVVEVGAAPSVDADNEATTAPRVTTTWSESPSLARDVVGSSLVALPGMLALFLIARLDFFLLKMLLPVSADLSARAASDEVTAQVGLYAAAYAVAELLMIVGYAVSMAYAPMVANAPMSEAAVVARTAAFWILVVGGVAATVLALLAPWVLRLYGGEEFAPAANALRWLAPGIALHYVYIQSHQLMVRAGQWARINTLLIGAALLNGALNIALIPTYGLSGAAAATTATMVVLVIVAITGFLISNPQSRAALT